MSEIEKAIEYFEYLISPNILATMDNDDYEAMSLALEALKEKAEREKGCEFCNDEKWLETDGEGAYIEGKQLIVKGYNEADTEIDIDFCIKCGRKL